MLDRIPPLQMPLGRVSVSRLQGMLIDVIRMGEGKCLRSVSARSGVISAKVGAGVASEARLHLSSTADLGTVGSVTDQHSESLKISSVLPITS
jgi:hypothetical protein